MRVVLGTSDFVAVAFNVPIARFDTARSLERFAAVAGLGPDVLGHSFAADEAASRLVELASEEVGNVLLNQRVLAGVGNVFKSEICFACGVHPFRTVASLRTQEIDCLLSTARRMLAANVAAGDGIVTYTGGPAHHRARETIHCSPIMGLSPSRIPVPPLRNVHPHAQTRDRRSLHLLVPGMPEGAVKKRQRLPRRLFDSVFLRCIRARL